MTIVRCNMRRIDLDEAGCIGNQNGEAIYILKEGESVAILNTVDRILRRDAIYNPDKLSKVKMRFVKFNPSAPKEWGMKYPLILVLLDYIQYQTGKLVYRNGVTINRTNLAKVCGVSPSTIDRQLKGLIEEDVIKPVKDGRDTIFYVNPYVVHVGPKVQNSLLELFSGSRYKDTYEKTLERKKK